MSDEDAFQAALDANPDDHVTRLVFADWLQDRGDERAEGYRAMGVMRRVPVLDLRDGQVLWFRKSTTMTKEWSRSWWFTKSSIATEGVWPESCTLVDDWLDLMSREFHHWINSDFRREAEDAAARAFTLLPASRRTELLSPPLTV